VVGVAVSIALVSNAIGTFRTVWAAVGAVLLVVLTSGVGLWRVGRRMRSDYLEAAVSAWPLKIEARSGPDQTDYVDPYLLRKEIVPAFWDAGLQRSRSDFLQLVDSLNLEDEAATREKTYVERVVADSSLPDEVKIELLVRHFAPTFQTTADDRSPY
jgi:hypothetical protein